MASKLIINPPLLNSASPWATTLTDLEALYKCPYTGAVTTRTTLINGFRDDPNIHQHCFFDAGAGARKGADLSVRQVEASSQPIARSSSGNSSLNTYGYSPIPLRTYLSYIEQLVQRVEIPASTTDSHDTTTTAVVDLARIASPTRPTKLPTSASKLVSKPIIISVTGEPHEIGESYRMISELASRIRNNSADYQLILAMEINLSCPNIAHKPPPAYNATQLNDLLAAIAKVKIDIVTADQNQNPNNNENAQTTSNQSCVALGLKLPPYTYHDQFRTVAESLASTNKVQNQNGSIQIINFITTTNTLGSSLVLTEDNTNSSNNTHVPALNSESGTGIGGLAGAAIHSLSLGNVATFRRLLDQTPETKHVQIIGVGGVSDRAGFERMRAAGADFVGVATAFGAKGLKVFEEIASHLPGFAAPNVEQGIA